MAIQNNLFTSQRSEDYLYLWDRKRILEHCHLYLKLFKRWKPILLSLYFWCSATSTANKKALTLIKTCTLPVIGILIMLQKNTLVCAYRSMCGKYGKYGMYGQSDQTSKLSRSSKHCVGQTDQNLNSPKWKGTHVGEATLFLFLPSFSKEVQYWKERICSSKSGPISVRD